MTVTPALPSDIPRRWSPAKSSADNVDRLVERLRAQNPSRRSDLLSMDQLRRHAERLAGEHRLASEPGKDRLLGRLEENARCLEDAYRVLSRAAAERRGLPPAAAWLLDNYYLIQEQVRLARQHLPRKYSLQLPRLSEGPRHGLPRVYDLALELITHVDGQIDQESLHQFIGVYQQVAVLKLGELWAVPIMLRLALLENIRGVALRTVDGLSRPHSADHAADQLSMSNSISSLRALGALDWKEFVETQSVMEKILRRDPADIYARMDFQSRDRYRRVVESLAWHGPLNEQQVAQFAVDLATRGGKTAGDLKQRHVGYYLVDRGRPLLEEHIGHRASWKRRAARFAGRAPLACYLGAILLVWFLTVGGTAWAGVSLGAGLITPGVGLLLLMLFAGAASQFAISIVNWFCTLWTPPRATMRLDFSTGIPQEHRALVAVPTLLSSEKAVAALVDQLEVRYLANQDGNLCFALVTDFPDADEEVMPADQRLLHLARQGVEKLNRRYCGTRPCIFFLLHRPRKWNAREGAWMGEERKRGKLTALNHLLLSGRSDAFSVVVGELDQLTSIRYVITLDTDTQLPRDVARELVGCMAHPLNRPRLDPRTRQVVEGHAILQPRITTTIPEANRSLFSRLFAGDAGIDPYTRETSDLYQDVFDEGSFIGKGIYDVEAFEASLAGRFPDNRVLSHDLIEGCFARSGVVNDVDLFEGYPSRLLADMSRRHRWIRGDWQIAAWLGRGPAAPRRDASPLSLLSRWKIFDNLRRSLVPVFWLAFLLAAWLLAPPLAGYWTLLSLALFFGPTVIAALPGFFRKPPEKPLTLHLKDQGSAWLRAMQGEAVCWCILPYTAHCHMDAITRTLYRLHVSGRSLLEWTTAGEAESRCEGDCRGHYEVMWACSITSLAAAALLTVAAPLSLAAAGPVLLAWLAGPGIAWWISQPRRARQVQLNGAQTRQLRRLARQTWHYFEAHVSEQEHWLPPDNVQEYPPTVAARTSPTNIGMGLLADLAACDLGHLPGTEFLERVARMFHTLSGLERYHGHFYNWYDTRTLQPAEPRYVSTVDSGNLWGALLVLRAGLEEMRERPLLAPRLWEGLRDTVEVIAALRARNSAASPTDRFAAGLIRLRDECAVLERGGNSPFLLGTHEASHRLTRIRALAADLAANVPSASSNLAEWTGALVRQAAAAHRELSRLAFWTALPHPFPEDAKVLEEAKDFNAWFEGLDAHCTLAQVPRAAEQALERSQRLREALADRPGDSASREEWLSAFCRAAEKASAAARRQLEQIAALAQQCQELSAMDFAFLFHPKKKLLAVGFNVTEHRRDNSFYDLLASESRLTSFLAISHGQLPQEHWFALGRVITMADGEPTLLSWSGSMFEYLMPLLLMPSYPDTVLDASCRAAVRRQIRYGRRRRVPWGISESCYHATDANLTYQYRAFGVPGLGLERGLSENLVIAPYAAAMAVMIAPREACENMMLLEELGYLSPSGFYDAIDHTPSRRLSPEQPALCRVVMAHHSGMSLLAMAHVLLGGLMQRRFLKDPLCLAHDLLLQERVSSAVRPVDPESLDTGPAPADGEGHGPGVRVFDSPRTAMPEVHLLSNGNYHVMLTVAGGGASRWGRLALTHWRPEAAGVHFGQCCYLRDARSGSYWSTTYAPANRDGERYQAVFSQGKVEYRMVREEIDARTQVGVSPEDDVEVRRLTLTNLGRSERAIELTSFGEVAVSSVETDHAHDGAGNSIMAESLPQAILLTGRAQPPDEGSVWIFHLLHVQARAKTEVSFETSLQQFVGSERTLERPAALEQPGPLGGRSGPTSDAIFSLRQAFTMASDESVVAYVVSGAAATREKALAAMERYRDARLADRVFELSAAHSRLALQRLRMTEAEAQLYARLASALLYGGTRRGEADPLPAPGSAGHRPLVVIHLRSREGGDLVRQVLAAHGYWRGKGLEVDLAMWLDAEDQHLAELYQWAMDLMAAGPSANLIGGPGGIHIFRRDQHAPERLAALREAASLVFCDEEGSLEEQGKNFQRHEAARI